MATPAKFSSATEKRQVGGGDLYLMQVGEESQLPFMVTGWPSDSMDAAVLHLKQEPQPELVVMLYELRRALGNDGLLYLACHDDPHMPGAAHTRAYHAASLVGHSCRGNTSDHSFSVWSGELVPSCLPHLTKLPLLQRGDLSRRTSVAILRLLPPQSKVMEIWPRLGRFTAQALRQNHQPTVVLHPTAKERSRLLAFVQRRS